MPRNLGTRQQQNFEQERIDQGHDSRFSQEDPGLSKYVSASVTFTSTQLTAANGTFTAFAVGDAILVGGTNKNNGRKIVTAIDGTNQSFLTVDPPPVVESAVTAIVRSV